MWSTCSEDGAGSEVTRVVFWSPRPLKIVCISSPSPVLHSFGTHHPSKSSIVCRIFWASAGWASTVAPESSLSHTPVTTAELFFLAFWSKVGIVIVTRLLACCSSRTLAHFQSPFPKTLPFSCVVACSTITTPLSQSHATGSWGRVFFMIGCRHRKSPSLSLRHPRNHRVRRLVSSRMLTPPARAILD